MIDTDGLSFDGVTTECVECHMPYFRTEAGHAHHLDPHDDVDGIDDQLDADHVPWSPDEAVF